MITLLVIAGIVLLIAIGYINHVVENNKKSLGIYVHIPFCRSKCEYCDFYSLPGASKPVCR